MFKGRHCASAVILWALRWYLAIRFAADVAALTTVLSEMAADGHPVTPAPVASLSPYTRTHILRFGQYALDMANLPEPLDPQPLPFEKTL